MIHRRCEFFSLSLSIFRAEQSFILDRTVRLLGQGTFGKVVEALDTHTNNRVAVKIIRAIPKYRDASKIEIRVLQKLKDKDPQNRQYVVLPPSLPVANNVLIVLVIVTASIYYIGLITGIMFA